MVGPGPTVVVCAAFDERGDAALAGISERLRALGVRTPRSPNHRPHITLDAATVEDPSAVSAITAEVAARHGSFLLTLDRVGTFGRGRVLWLGPSRSGELTELHGEVHASLTAAGFAPAFGEHSEPGAWTAHCTLARHADPRAAARLRAGFEPLEVRVAALATLLVGGRGDLTVSPLRR